MPDVLESAGSCRVAEGQGRAAAGARKPAATGFAYPRAGVPTLAAAAAIGLDEDRLPTCLIDAS